MDLSKLTLEIFSRLEQQWLLDCDVPSPSKKTRILSIDGGGGLRPLIAGEALIRLEDSLISSSGDPSARISDFFDLISGSGLGALLAALLSASASASDNRPLFSAREAVSFLRRSRREIFLSPTGFFRRRRKGRFSSRSLESVLREAFRKGSDGRDLTLRDTCKPLLIPCYDLETSAPFVFSRADAAQSPSFDFDLWRVCRAASATPTQFEPFRFNSVDGRTTCTAVDGGLVMNNPAAAAVTHVLHNKRDFPTVHGVDDLFLLSLGTGRGGGGRRSCSGPSVVEIAFDGVSDTVDQMLGNAFSFNPLDYVRIQANGVGSEDEGASMEDVTEEGAERMRKVGENMLKERGVESLPFGGKRLLTETNGERIDGFVKRLVDIGKSLPPSPEKGNAVRSLVDGC
ncbi:hypothetical protein QJS10_CPB17g01873 [Acorus calamus]|uniref:Patatin n=1 Tax=Acorus calamus TaxID=4465 RepID=A0AAV9CQW5_ACOCL|nr:hypothetical protein QJS10_CPB17g01873 [Acorus calamus]